MVKLCFFISTLYSNDKADNSWSGTINLLGQFIYIFLSIAVVLFFIYIFLKFTAKLRLEKKGINNLEIIESMAVSYQNFVQIIRVGDKYFLIGVNKDKVTFLTQLDGNELKFNEENGNIAFEDCFGERLKKLLKKN